MSKLWCLAWRKEMSRKNTQYMDCGVPLAQVTMGTGRPTTVWYGECDWPSCSYWIVPGTYYDN